jgi:hypothetical protein
MVVKDIVFALEMNKPDEQIPALLQKGTLPCR